MINMRMSREEVTEYGVAPSATDQAPAYPYGLCICLDDDALAKLGIQQLPAVGTTMLLRAVVSVKSTSAEATQGGESEARMELQITDMELEGAAKPDTSSVLYST